MTARRSSVLASFVLMIVLAMTLAPVPVGAAQAAGSLELVAQSAWVDDGGVFDVQVRVAGANPESSVIVEVFPSLTDRSQLGVPQTPESQPELVIGPVALTSLQSTSNEVLSLQIAVAGPDTQPADSIDVIDPDDEPIPVLRTEGETGIYPLRIRLVSADGELADELTTHILELRPGRIGDPLQVVIIVPIEVGTTADENGRWTLDDDPTSQLTPLIESLETHPQSNVALDVEPHEIAVLRATDDPALQELLGRLAEQIDPDNVFPRAGIRVDDQAWIDASLDQELRSLYDRGDATLVDFIGSRPDRSVALAQSTLTTDGVAWLMSEGVNGVLVDSAQLERVAIESINTPLTSSFVIPLTSDATIPALEIDRELSSLFGPTDQPVLDANRLLAELTMRALEAPGENRGSVLRAPDGWTVSNSFLNVLLSGIERIPAIESSSAKSALETIDFMPATGPGTISAPLRRSLLPTPTASLGSYRTEYNQARAAIESWETVVSADAPDQSSLSRLLRASADSSLSEADRVSYIDSIYRLIDEQKDTALEAQPTETITLTARTAEVPIVINNRLANDVSVVMLLDSEKLAFPDGREVPWILEPGENRIDVQIEALASGDSPIRIQFMSPDRQVLLGSSELLIRTIAFSGVGIVIGSAAIGVLLLWWLRHRRSLRATLDSAATA